jgi:hypothetical protein
VTTQTITFVIHRDGDVWVFDSIEGAALEVEGRDVVANEYVLFCTADGERLEPRVLDELRVELRRTGEFMLDQLTGLLTKHAERNGIVSPPDDLAAVATELFRRRHTSDAYPELSRTVRDGEGNHYEVFAHKGYEGGGWFRVRHREFPIVGVLRETESGVRHLPHAERARDEADARTIIHRIARQIEDGSFEPKGEDLG